VPCGRRTWPKTTATLPLSRLRWLKALCVKRLTAHWVHCLTYVQPVSKHPAVFRFTVPRFVSDPGSFFLAYAPPQSSFASSPAPRLAAQSLPTKDLFPLRGITRSRPLHTKVPPSATFRPRTFSAPRRLTPRPDATGLFHPATTSRVRPVQGLLPPRSCDPVTRFTCPLAVGVPVTRHPKITAMPGRLDFEAFIHTETRSHTVWFYPGRRPLPSSGRSSSRSPARRLPPGSPGRSAHELGALHLRVAAEAPTRSYRSPLFSVLRPRTFSRNVSAPTTPARGFEPSFSFPSNSALCAS